MFIDCDVIRIMNQEKPQSSDRNAAFAITPSLIDVPRVDNMFTAIFSVRRAAKCVFVATC